MTNRYSKYIKEVQLIGEILLLNISYFLVYILTVDQVGTIFRSAYFEPYLFFNIAWIISAFFIKIHDESRVASFERVVRKLLNALGFYLILIFAFLGIKNGAYDKLFVFYAYCVTSTGIGLFNIAFVLFLKYYRKVGYNYRNVVIVGYGQIATNLRKYFTYNPELGYRFMGYFDNESSNSVVRGKVMDAMEMAKVMEIDEIYCVLPYLDYNEVQQLTKFAEDNFIKIHAIPDFRGFPYKKIEVQLYDVIPVLNFPPQPLDDHLNRVLKRFFDIVVTGFLSVLVLPWLIPLIAILIKLDSKGPIFFKQLRSGINNEPFVCYKFRTMEENETSDRKQATMSDPRITGIGAILRKTSLDEIPQFLNVLKGEMSIVGPRPHMLKHTEEFSRQVDKFMLRHYVKPGITGLAQAKGYRGETNTHYKLKNRIKLDRFYVENWSLLFDLKILVATFLVMLKGDKNAY